MNDFIRQLKETNLLQLERQRNNIADSKTSLYAQKYSVKEKKNNEMFAVIDQKFEEEKRQKLQEVNDQIAMLRANYDKYVTETAEKVQLRKDSLCRTAMDEANREAEAEISLSLAEVDKEIAAIKKDLGK